MIVASLVIMGHHRTHALLAIITTSIALLCAFTHGFTLVVPPENEAQVLQAVGLYNDARDAADRGEPALAMQLYEHALAVYALLPGAYNNLGMLVYAETRDVDHAVAILQRGATTAHQVNDTETLASLYNNMGVVTRNVHPKSVVFGLKAIEYFDLALAAKSDFVDALHNKAEALWMLHHHAEAAALLQRLLELQPEHVRAHMTLGGIYFYTGAVTTAVYHEDKVIEYATRVEDKTSALHNKGHFLKEAGEWAAALEAHEAAVALAPHDPIALGDLVTARRTLCRWQDRENLVDRLVAAVAVEAVHATALMPYDSTLLQISGDFRRRVAIANAETFEQPSTLALDPLRPIQDPPRPLRIGYVSYDFRDHPMGHLTLGLLDAHDASRVDRFCYSYGPHDGSEWRQRVEQRCDQFVDGAAITNLEFARRIAVDNVDILVDLMAHTKGARVEIPSLRPTRIAINYLGFPGTTGASFMDFVIADRVVAPPETAANHFRESVVYLPHAYQVNQYEPWTPSCVDEACIHSVRAKQAELPQDKDAVVLVNFNTIDKMEPQSFGVWMNVLRRVPGSVLWLLQPAKRHVDDVIATLRREAQAHGVHPGRLVFAPWVSKREHLARLTAADLFLDSFVYNAHSTAADTLWANVPLLTLEGDAFPSRVASSLLRNLVEWGSDVLAPHSVKDYEAMAVLLATRPALRLEIRRRLAAHTLIAPLFNSAATTDHIETAYEILHDLRHRLEPMESLFHVAVSSQLHGTLLPSDDVVDAKLNSVHALAFELHENGRLQDAVAMYTRILSTVPSHGDAHHLLGIAFFQMGQTARAIDQLFHTVELHNTTALYRYNLAVVLLAAEREHEAERELWTALLLEGGYRDAFRSLTTLLLRRGRFESIVEAHKRFGKSVIALETDGEREGWLLQFSYALSRVGRTGDAVVMLTAARNEYPTLFRLGYNLAAFTITVGEHAAGDEVQMTTAIAESRHVFTERGRLFAKQPRPAGRRVVVFYCHEYGQSWWGQWGPSSLGTGLGGSEEAVVFLANELQRRGHWVEVYGNPRPEDMEHNQVEDRVKWYPHQAWDPEDAGVDVFVAWRYHISLVLGQRSRVKIFWVHDMPTLDTKHSRLLKETVDRVVCVSRFQASQYPSHLAAKLVVSPNALSPSFLADGDLHSSQEQSTRFVYGSAPNRGLQLLLEAWPRIRTVVPRASLRVFYGFTPAFLDWGQRNIPDFDRWKQRMEILLAQPGVEYVGLVDHATLTREYAAAGFYLYPTQYSETSCVSLMKAMAHGAIPITSRFITSALDETTSGFDLGPRPLQEGAEDVIEWLPLWVESIRRAVEDVEGSELFRRRMVQFARGKYQWASIAAQWETFWT